MSEPESPAECSYQGCTRPVHGDTGLCIFHAPADQKDPQAFRNALARQIREWRNEKATTWDFRGWVFVDVDRKPKASWAPEKYNLFRRAVFPVVTIFHHVQFETVACFVDARFLGIAHFQAAQFGKYASFRCVQFTQHTVFRSAQFMHVVDFTSSVFTLDADFISVHFLSHAIFAHAQFKLNVDFGTPQFEGNADFKCSQFTLPVSFQCAKFKKQAIFESSQFLSFADFSLAQFTDDANFMSAGFTEGASFNSAQFTGDALFVSAIFFGTAEFASTMFEKANFLLTTFRAPASFEGVRFMEMDLSYAVFAVEGHINLGALDRHAVLRWPGPGKRYDEEHNEIKRGTLRIHAARFSGNRGCLDLRGNVLGDDANLVLKRCDMGRILLGLMDWTRLEIVAPRWRCIGGRKTIGDEYVPRKLLKRSLVQVLARRPKNTGESDADIRLDPASVADTYLLLTKRFREDLKHAWANDFNCGAFAMNRLAPPDQSCIGQRLCSVLRNETGIAPLRWLKWVVYQLLLLFKRYFSLTALYGLTAGYGRSILRPVFSLVVINAVGGLWYKLLCGWTIGSIWREDRSFGHICRVFVKAVADGCTIVTFKHTPTDLVPPSEYTSATIIGVVQIVLTAIMAALTLFAIRRRFRHG